MATRGSGADFLPENDGEPGDNNDPDWDDGLSWERLNGVLLDGELRVDDANLTCFCCLEVVFAEVDSKSSIIDPT